MTTLRRILEPELMDTPTDAREYDAMDHSAVNAQFVTDLLRALSDWSLKRSVQAGRRFDILDLGAGTAQIAIELARRAPHVYVTAIDAAPSMLELARKNLDTPIPLPLREGQGEGSSTRLLEDRIQLLLADAKQLPFHDKSFSAVMSNSIVHHIADPHTALAEAVRVTAPGGLLFHRDLARPAEEAQLTHLVETYAGSATSYQRKLFADSLRAALTLDEIRDLISGLGFARTTVLMTSDRHWTWMATTK